MFVPLPRPSTSASTSSRLIMGVFGIWELPVMTVIAVLCVLGLVVVHILSSPWRRSGVPGQPSGPHGALGARAPRLVSA